MSKYEANAALYQSTLMTVAVSQPPTRSTQTTTIKHFFLEGLKNNVIETSPSKEICAAHKPLIECKSTEL